MTLYGIREINHTFEQSFCHPELFRNIEQCEEAIAVLEKECKRENRWFDITFQPKEYILED